MRLSQAQVAQVLHISQQYYSRIEKGRKRPATSLGQEIAHFFGLTIEEMWKILYSSEGGQTHDSTASAS